MKQAELTPLTNMIFNERKEMDRTVNEFETASERFIKRILDVLASIFGLLVTAPAIVVIYLLIKREDNGPAIYRQERIGYGGKPFTLYKFRSMKMDAEHNGPQLYNTKNDNRLTRVGKFIREHHLDELPQFWNVLKGDMSFIGPRPERQFYINKIMEVNPDYVKLYQVRPGLFSYATLYNGYTDTLEKMLVRLQMDLDYLSNRTLWTDFKIICLTILSILTGKKF